MALKLAIHLFSMALLIAVGTAEAQQPPDPRISALVQAGKVRVGLFSAQYIKDATTGELRGVRVEMARTLAARMGVQAVLLEGRSPSEVVDGSEGGECEVVFLPFDERAANVGEFSSSLTRTNPADASRQYGATPRP